MTATRLPLQPLNDQQCCSSRTSCSSAVPSEPIEPPNHLPRGHRCTKYVLQPGSHHVTQVPVVQSPSSSSSNSSDPTYYWLKRQLCEEKDRTRVWKAYPLQQITNGRGQTFWRPLLSRPVVVKESLLSSEPYYGRGEDALTEMAAMLMLEKPQDHGVVRLLDYFLDDDTTYGQILYTVLPYLEGDDAFNLIKKTNKGQGMEEDMVKAIMGQVVDSLLYLKQDYRLRHGDISPENIMVHTNHKGDIYTTLIDLGMVEQVPERAQGGGPVIVKGRPYRGKRQYMPNEIYLGKDHDPFAADVWSLGTVMYVMLTGCALYNSPKDEVFSYLQRPGGVRRLIDLREARGYVVPMSDEAKDLICGCLHHDPAGRLTLEDIAEHSWINQLLQDYHDDLVTPSPASSSTTTVLPSLSIVDCLFEDDEDEMDVGDDDDMPN